MMAEHLPPLELWMQDIQSYLYRVLSAPLSRAGFRFDKYNYSFTRQYVKNTQEIGILFINQFPVNYRVTFVLEIRNKKVAEAKSAFFHSLKRDDFKLNSLIVSMKDFGENESESKKDLILFGNRELFDAAEIISTLLQNETIPLCNSLSSLQDMDNFYETHPGWSVTNYHIDNIVSELFVAKLNQKRNFQLLYDEISDRIKRKDSPRRIDTDAGVIVDRCYQFIMKKY